MLNILSDLVSMYANMNPGVQYGIKYNKSLITMLSLNTCSEPNINPDININKYLFLYILYKQFLNTIYYINGAYITDAKYVYIGASLNVSLIEFSLLAISFVYVNINKLLIIMTPNIKNQ